MQIADTPWSRAATARIAWTLDRSVSRVRALRADLSASAAAMASAPWTFTLTVAFSATPITSACELQATTKMEVMVRSPLAQLGHTPQLYSVVKARTRCSLYIQHVHVGM